jgi:hypothetical protein
MRTSLIVILAVFMASSALWVLSCVGRRSAKPVGLEAPKKSEQAVLVYLDGVGLPNEIYAKYDLQGLEDRVNPILRSKHLGEFDGEDTGQKETVLYFYGPDAEALFAAIEPELRAYPLCLGARVVLRKGPPGSPSRELRLPSAG